MAGCPSTCPGSLSMLPGSAILEEMALPFRRVVSDQKLYVPYINQNATRAGADHVFLWNIRYISYNTIAQCQNNGQSSPWRFLLLSKRGNELQQNVTLLHFLRHVYSSQRHLDNASSNNEFPAHLMFHHVNPCKETWTRFGIQAGTRIYFEVTLTLEKKTYLRYYVPPL